MSLRISSQLMSSRLISRAAYTSSLSLAQTARFTTTPARRLDPFDTEESSARLAASIAVDDFANAFSSSSMSSTSSVPDSKPPESSSLQKSKARTTPVDTVAPSSLLPYHISRTPSNNLPVYHDTRNGNTRKETVIRKISGDPRPLRDAIRELLGVDAEKVWIGKVTGHIYAKGHHKPAIEKFLAEKGF